MSGPALSRLFAPVIAIVNRRIGETTPARELCARLDGKSMAVRVRNTGFAICIRATDARVEFVDPDELEADAVISGSLLSLARLTGDAGEQLIRDGTLELSGDATIAEDFRRLLHYGRPDWEEQLSGAIGDVAAHGIGEMLRNVARWGRQARQTMSQNVGEYLQEESRALPSRVEVDAFRHRVHDLRDDVDRLAARLKRLEAAAGDD